MLKELVKYTDYNDVEQEETLYFNLTKTELADMLDLKPRLEAWSKMTTGPDRDLTDPEIKEMLAIVKFLIEKSYGQRSEDGKHFRKSQQIFDDFSQSAVYDAFVFGMFQFPERAIEFMMGILPKGLEDPALAEAKKNALDIAEQLQTARGAEVVELPQPSIEDSETPAYIRENREPTREELQNMSKEEMQRAFARRGSKE